MNTYKEPLHKHKSLSNLKHLTIARLSMGKFPNQFGVFLTDQFHYACKTTQLDQKYFLKGQVNIGFKKSFDLRGDKKRIIDFELYFPLYDEDKLECLRCVAILRKIEKGEFDE